MADLTFRFGETGADKLASGMRKVSDAEVMAARGARVLKDALEKQRRATDVSAGAALALAKADDILKEAEDGLRDGALEAEFALKKQADAEKKAAAAALLDAEAQKKAAQNRKDALKGLSGPGLLGPLVALAPAIASLAGVATGAAVGLGGAFIAGGAALAAFGVVAKPVLADAKTAATAVEKAQSNYNAAIASGTKQSVAYKAEQLAIAKAYAGMSPAQIALSKQLGAMADSWDAVKAAETPVVAGALQPWLKSVTDLTKNLAPIIAKISPVIQGLGSQFGNLVNSSAFKGFRDFIGSTGSAAVSAGGSTIIDLVKSFMILLPKFDPLIREAVGWISRLGPAVLTWASSKKASDDITKFLQWFSQNGHVVGDLIKNIGGALKALAPGLASGGALEIKVISDFLGFIAKLPPAIAKPLAEVAGAMLILQKTGVVSVGLKLIGMDAAKAAAGGGALGLWGKMLPGVRLAGGVLAMTLIVDAVLKSTSSGPGGKNWFDNPFGMPGPKDNASANNWLTSWSPYLNKFKQNFSGMTAFVSGSWSKTANFLHGSWSQTANFLTGSWAKLGPAFSGVLHVISVAWHAVWGALQTAFRNFVVNGVLGPLGTIIHGAAAAFGWVPGLGGKLQGAAKAFDTFRNNVNKSLGGINNKTVNVSVAMTSKTNPYPGGISGRAAAGLYVAQGTGPTADDVLIRASRGELIVPARMVQAGAVDHLRGSIPGFAAGGAVGVSVSAHTPSAAAVQSQLMASVMTLAKAFGAAASAVTSVPVGNVGSGVMRWAPLVLQALKMEGLGSYLASQVLYQMMTESGGNPNAINLTDSNAARGDPSRGLMQTIGSTFRAYHWPGTSWNIYDPLANIAAAINYARHVYGPSLGALGSGHGYAQGGLVPGFASGGSVAQQGQTFLNAWRSRHGGPYALAIGPKVLNEQIPEMAAALGRARTLAGARGLSKGQHAFWAKSAASETRELATLYKERATEQAWRGQLQLSELGLDKEIRAAGNLPGLAGPVRGWKAQLAAHKYTVGQISRMLGTSNAQQAAAKAKAKPPAPTGVLAKHVYGGDVANNLGTVLAAALGPFTGAARGGLLMDSGGTLRPGWNAAYNGTGRPEQLVPARGGSGTIRLEVSSGGSSEFDQFMTGWLRKHVRVKGGGSVQHAFGAH